MRGLCQERECHERECQERECQTDLLSSAAAAAGPADAVSAVPDQSAGASGWECRCVRSVRARIARTSQLSTCKYCSPVAQTFTLMDRV